jgi:hypothetical protein
LIKGGENELLVKVCPDVHEKDKDEEDTPACERTCATPELVLVKEGCSEECAKDLRHPIEQVIK